MLDLAQLRSFVMVAQTKSFTLSAERLNLGQSTVSQHLQRLERSLGRRLIEELPAWFENHVNGMDAALAFHLDSIGFDFEQGALKPLADGEQRGAGCACASMNTPETVSTPAAATAA